MTGLEQRKSTDFDKPYSDPIQSFAVVVDAKAKADTIEDEHNGIVRYTYNIPTSITNENCYFIDLRFDNQVASNITVKAYLQGTDVVNQEEQGIGMKYYMAEGAKEQKRIVFRPKYNHFTKLIIEARSTQGSVTNKDEVVINISHFNIVKNQIEKFTLPKSKIINAIGIQAPPEMLFVLNDEDLRVGNSGVFEAQMLDIHLEHIGFLPTDESEVFLVDYSYTPDRKES